MPEYEAVSDLVVLLKLWAQEVPRSALQGSEVAEARARFGDRHGSWTLALDWNQGGLDRSAELALTNPEVTSDEVSKRSIVTARASASTDDRYVVEVVYEKSRAVGRVTDQVLLELLTAAIDRAAGYGPAALVDAYETGLQALQ